MSDILAGQFKVCFGWAMSLADALEGDEWLRTPDGVAGHPWWLYGHLAEAGDFGHVMTGGGRIHPPEWEGLFSIGSVPRPDGADYPAVTELRDAHRRNLEAALALLGSLDEEMLERAPVYPEVAEHFPTNRRYLLFQPIHMGYHLGQFRRLVTALRGSAGGP